MAVTDRKPYKRDNVVMKTAAPGKPKFTPELASRFLAHLALDPNVTEAAKACDITRARLYEERKKNPEFKAAWDEAIEAAIESMETEVRRRAFKGYTKPVYQQGMLIGFVQEYSDQLAMFMLRAARPEVYRERTEVDVKVTERRLVIEGGEGGLIPPGATIEGEFEEQA